MVASSMDAEKHAENSEQSDENKQLAASKLHNVRVSTNGARGRAPVGVRPRRCEARAALHTLTSVNQRLTPIIIINRAAMGRARFLLCTGFIFFRRFFFCR